MKHQVVLCRLLCASTLVASNSWYTTKPDSNHLSHFGLQPQQPKQGQQQQQQLQQTKQQQQTQQPTQEQQQPQQIKQQKQSQQLQQQESNLHISNQQDYQRETQSKKIEDHSVLDTSQAAADGKQEYGGQSHESPQKKSLTCDEGLVKGADGSCIVPVIHQNFFFVFGSPLKIKGSSRSPIRVAEPNVEQNFVFIRSQEEESDEEGPILIPPAQQKTQVYVLNKKQESRGQKVIEVPSRPPPKPEVFFLNYAEGDNPQLPGGIDLQTALLGAAENAQSFIASSEDSINASPRAGLEGVGDFLLDSTAGGGEASSSVGIASSSEFSSSSESVHTSVTGSDSGTVAAQQKLQRQQQQVSTEYSTPD